MLLEVKNGHDTKRERWANIDDEAEQLGWHPSFRSPSTLTTHTFEVAELYGDSSLCAFHHAQPTDLRDVVDTFKGGQGPTASGADCGLGVVAFSVFAGLGVWRNQSLQAT